ANKLGYNVIVCVSDESFDKEVINMEMLANGSVDGFIMSLSAETQKKNDFNHLKEIMEQGIPFVLFDRVTNEIDCDKVLIDDKEAALLAVNKFIKNGRKKIALVTTEDYFSVSKAREAGYREALSTSNLKIDESLILKLPFMDVDENALNEFFNNHDIDAVLCVNEIFAIHCMNLVQKKGMRIPEDISFIGFTDGILSKYAIPGLTSIAQHGDKMGEVAAKMLIEKIEHESEDEEEVGTFRTEIVETTLIERGSTIN
ncbi:MAG: LacI family transcriptional regulator, partial [Maribacter sp.]|nr:LacI family transcriptional regulator [Maribacter sp.]